MDSYYAEKVELLEQLAGQVERAILAGRYARDKSPEWESEERSDFIELYNDNVVSIRKSVENL